MLVRFLPFALTASLLASLALARTDTPTLNAPDHTAMIWSGDCSEYSFNNQDVESWWQDQGKLDKNTANDQVDATKTITISTASDGQQTFTVHVTIGKLLGDQMNIWVNKDDDVALYQRLRIDFWSADTADTSHIVRSYWIQPKNYCYINGEFAPNDIGDIKVVARTW